MEWLCSVPNNKTMKYLAFLIFSIFYFTQNHSKAQGDKICRPSCRSFPLGPQVRFPFQIKDRPSDHPCAYTGLFDLSCNYRNQTILNIATIGDLVVTKIDYVSQELFVDPQLCSHPGRILSFSLSDSHFTSPYKRYYTFYNCSSALKVEYPKIQLSCFSGQNYTVFGIATNDDHGMVMPICRRISLVDLPVQQWSVPHEALNKNFQLSWHVPDCSACERRGGTCVIKSTATSFEIDCYDHDTKSRSTSTPKLGIYLGIGLPSLLIAAIVVAYIRSKRNVDSTHHQNTELSAIISNPQQSVIHKGLDDATIQSYMKTVLDEKCQLPEPNNSTCPICLSDYKPKDTLRTIPKCGHYFHINCIDEWLKLNATCPVCRNSH